MIVTINRYTRYYQNYGGGGEISPVYRTRFRMERGKGIGSFFRRLFHFVIPLVYSGPKASEKRR